MNILENYSLLRHNTFGMDVHCRKFVDYENKEELLRILSTLQTQKNIRFLQIGAGSNLLFLRDYDGVILHSSIKCKQLVEMNGDEVLLRVGAGENWDELVAWCVDKGYFGLENLSYIPGEVGAAAVQNIGAYGQEVGEAIVAVEAVSVETLQSCTFDHGDCHYAYRQSIFKGSAKGKYIVTAVVFRLSLKFSPRLTYGVVSRELEDRGIELSTLTASTLRKMIIDVRRSKLPEPHELGSAGSFFMNPVVPRGVARRILEQYPRMPHYVLEDGVKIPAGWLIEQCGWKGKKIGHVGAYEKQALVLVNHGGATGEEIGQLSRTIQKDVLDKFGVEILPEVNFIE